MKTIYLILSLIFLARFAFAEGNVVRVKATSEIIYRQKPNFKTGLGIVNAIFLNPQYTKEELEEDLIDNRADVAAMNAAKKAEKEANKKAKKDALKATGLTEAQIDALDAYLKSEK